MVLDNRKHGAGAVYLHSSVRDVVQEKASGLSLHLELSGIYSVKRAGKAEKSSLGKKYLKKIFSAPALFSENKAMLSILVFCAFMAFITPTILPFQEIGVSSFLLTFSCNAFFGLTKNKNTFPFINLALY